MTSTEKVLLWLGGVAAVGLATFGLLHQAAGSQNKTVTLSTADSGKTVNLKVGDKLIINLPYDPTGEQVWMPMPGAGAGDLFTNESDQVVPVQGLGTVYQMQGTASKAGSTMIGVNLVNSSDPTTPIASWKVNVVVS
jgi:hypothetical protein